MRIINLISEDYEGNPRDSLGYSWKTLVMDNGKADHAKTRNGKTVSIKELTPIATITGMWCGGPNKTVYQVTDATRVVDEPVTHTNEPIDEPKHGYCNKCHTYCYGDCESADI